MKIRFSRPCYDKAHRCPGQRGGGLRYAKIQHCPNNTGSMVDMYDKRLWKWRFNYHAECGTIVFPYVIRYIDPTYWSHEIRFRIWKWRKDRAWARQQADMEQET